MATKPQSAIDRIRAANNNSYDATSNPGGLADGGHRQNFVPDLNAFVDVAEWAEDLTEETSTAAETASSDAAAATQKATEASQSAASALASKNAAAQSAAGINLPPITPSTDIGAVPRVKSDRSGYELKAVEVPLFLPITMTTPVPNATGLGAGGTYTFVVQAFAGDTVGFYPDYPVPLASRFVNVFEPGGNAPVAVLSAPGTGTAFPVNFTGSGLQTSKAYDFQAGYTDAQGNSVLSQRVRATTAAQFKPSVGQAYEGGYLAYEQFGDGGLFDLVTGAKSLESSRQYFNGQANHGALSRLNGSLNTDNIIAATASAPAAAYARSATFGSGTPYLAAIDEARAISFKLRPANAPAGSPFVSGGSEAFTNAVFHWTSTEVTASAAMDINMLAGTDNGQTQKSESRLVRPIKRIAVTPPIPIGTFVSAQGGWLWFYLTDLSDGTPKTYAVFKADKAVEATRAWDNQGLGQASTISRTNGPSNTNTLTPNAYVASRYCYDLVYNSKDDWYLGAIDEMLAGGRMNSQLPSAQQLNTSNQVFWSSTEIDASNAKLLRVNGSAVSEEAGSKTFVTTVVPIRRVLLSAL